jgi:Protein of unknown function (DUF4199)
VGRTIVVYGVIGGLIVAVGMLLGMFAVPDGGGAVGMVVGYLTMLVALTMVFIGVRSYRDTVGGGVIRFWPAFGLGLAIAFVASLFYVATWEIYMWQTGYTFMDDYVAGTIADMQAQGKTAAEIAAFSSEMEAFKLHYAQPLFRMAITLSEIAPVGLLVSLVSAAVLRNSRMFPSRKRG